MSDKDWPDGINVFSDAIKEFQNQKPERRFNERRGVNTHCENCPSNRRKKERRKCVL